MPQERGYDRQVTARAGAPMPLAQAEDFGAGVGRAVGAIGEQLHRSQLIDYKVQRQATAQSEWAQFQHGFALHRENMGGIAREARKDGSTGHAVRMGEAWDAARSALLDTITDDEVRQRATATFEDTGVRFRTGEADYEDVQRIGRTLQDWTDTENIMRARIRQLDKPADFPAELKLGQEAIAGLDLPPDQERAALAAWDKGAHISFIQGVTDRDPKLARAMLDSELFADLDQDTAEQLRGQADVEIRRQDAAAEHAANVARVEVRQRAAVLKERAGAGEDVSAELPTMIADARKAGDQVLEQQLLGIAGNTAFAKVYESMPPVQREQRMAMLAGKDRRSGIEDRELAWLKQHQGGLDQRFNSDPAGFYARSSTPPPPMDPADPASVQARSRWAATMTEATGRTVPVLTANEATQLRQGYQSGKRQDQLQVMEALGMFPAQQAAAAARMVAPTDRQLGVLVTLPKEYRGFAIDGRDALKSNPKLVRAETPDQEDFFATQDTAMRQALQALPPGQRDAYFAVAGQILAGLIDRAGEAGELTEGARWRALNMALGATGGIGAGQRGGVASWGGTTQHFLLPDRMRATDFYAGVQAAAKGAVKPVNRDGSPASLSRMYPVAVGAGIYEFRSLTGEPIKGSDGKAWRFQVGSQ